MAIHWQIPFRSLRTNTLYTVNIYDASYSGDPVILKGGEKPFTTQEDDNEDQFAPVRTQSGYIRIVDDGKDAAGNAFNWKTLVPVNDTDRPVTLTDGSNNIVWQGYMQAQNFGADLYNPSQEREYPVQCCLSSLAATQVSTTETQLCNFAYLLRYILNAVPQHSFTSYVIQGGSDAQAWLLKRLDWHNFLQDNADNDVEPKYNLYEILEDVCRFWGWTARTHKTVFYLTCADDTAEQSFLTLTPANLDTMAGGTAAGTTSGSFTPSTISGDVFASTENDDYKQRGPNKATVKADVNQTDMVIQFAPNSVRKLMEESPRTWQWVQEPGQDMVGYFTTDPAIGSFDSDILSGTSDATGGGYCRRQIYSSAEQDKPDECDMFLINHVYDGNPVISIQTKKAMSLRGGSITLGGTVYIGSQLYENNKADLMIRVGIGATRQTARWWYMEDIRGGSTTLNRGWSSPGTVEEFSAGLNGGRIISTKYYNRRHGYYVTFDAIPVFDESDLSGLVFVDILRLWDQEGQQYIQSFQIANFSIKFSRDAVDISSSTSVVRAREIVKERVNTQEYVATNTNQTHEEWNADCIFASDNNMEYGYGLLMNADGSFMSTAPYNGVSQHPEQHLASRVANYWAYSRRRIGADFRANTIPDVTPQYKITLDSTPMHPVAIARDWGNDVVRLTLLEMPS